jgi:hypothetical protein
MQTVVPNRPIVRRSFVSITSMVKANTRPADVTPVMSRDIVDRCPETLFTRALRVQSVFGGVSAFDAAGLVVAGGVALFGSKSDVGGFGPLLWLRS